MVKKISAHVLQCIDVAMFAGGHCKGRTISGSNFNSNLLGVFWERVEIENTFRDYPTFKARIAGVETTEGCPITPGTTLNKVCEKYIEFP